MKKAHPGHDSHPAKTSPIGMRRALLAWFDANRRDLPWRSTRDPYAIWVSEVMLQQTRVETILPRYSRFLSRFPTVGALARSRPADVLAEWSGLGYYRRARNLHAAARAIVRDHDGIFPDDPALAASLPGVGTYTSHAVLSIAYGRPLAVVDGNVERVLSRISLLPTRPRSIIQKEADRLLSPKRPGDANQALMELGATVCIPRSPRCGACPLRGACGAYRSDRVDRYPPAAPRPVPTDVATALWIVLRKGEIWLERRTVPPLRGLWMLPWRRAESAPGREPVARITHSITNRRFRCEIRFTATSPEAIPGEVSGSGRWVKMNEIGRLPHSSLLPKALAAAGIPIGEGGPTPLGRRAPGRPG